MIKDNTKRILIVDDSNKQRQLLSSTLRIKGFDVDVAEGGFHSIHLLEKKDFDLIVLDKEMEDMSGTEVLILIRSKEKFKSIPILVISTDGSESNILEAIDHGANDYCIKSTNLNTFLNKVNNLIGQK